MDFLKKASEKLGSGSKEQKPPQQGGDKPDYLDKAFESGAKQAGFGGKLNNEQREKVTDGIRGQFEKLTGKKVPEKFSN